MSKTATVERLTSMRFHGRVAAWSDLIAQGESSIASSKWLIDHVLDAEETDRAMRTVRHQLSAVKLPIHRDQATNPPEGSAQPRQREPSPVPTWAPCAAESVWPVPVPDFLQAWHRRIDPQHGA